MHLLDISVVGDMQNWKKKILWYFLLRVKIPWKSRLVNLLGIFHLLLGFEI